MQGVIKSYDPGTGDGVVLCDTDLAEYDLAAGRPRGLGVPHAPPGPAGDLRPRRRRPGHRACASAPRSTWAPRASAGIPEHPQRSTTDPPTAAGDDHDCNHHNQKLKDWVDEWAGVLQPDAIDWCDGSDEEYDRAAPAARRRRHLRRSSTRPSGPTASSPCPTRRRRPGRGPHLHLLRARRSTPAPPTTGGTRPR